MDVSRDFEKDQERAARAIPDEETDEFNVTRRDLMFYYNLIG